MIQINYLMILIMVCLFLTGCSSPTKPIYKYFPDKIYATAQQKIKSGDWKQAILQLKLLDNYHPLNPYYQRSQLDLIYAYYRNHDLLMAQDTIDRLMRFNPTHTNIDYITYMRGLVNMALDNNFLLDELFKVDHSSRNPFYAKCAFNNFSELVHRYPNSKYIKDATKRLILLKDRLAKHEYLIANYYSHCGAWIAVINRIGDMLHNYPNTKVTYDGLRLMENAYRKMHMNIQANKVAKIISNRY